MSYKVYGNDGYTHLDGYLVSTYSNNTNTANPYTTIEETIVSATTFSDDSVIIMDWPLQDGVTAVDLITTTVNDGYTFGGVFKLSSLFIKSDMSVSQSPVVDGGSYVTDPDITCTISNNATDGYVRVAGLLDSNMRWHIALRKQRGIF